MMFPASTTAVPMIASKVAVFSFIKVFKYYLPFHRFLMIVTTKPMKPKRSGPKLNTKPSTGKARNRSRRRNATIAKTVPTRNAMGMIVKIQKNAPMPRVSLAWMARTLTMASASPSKGAAIERIP